MSAKVDLSKDLEDAMFLFAYDDSKKVSCREVGAVIRSVGLNPTEAELKEMQDVVTKQFGGSIDARGLTQILQPRLQQLQTTSDELRDALEVFDKNGNGMIPIQDFKSSLTTLGERVPDEMMDELIREIDQDGDGQVSIDAAIRTLLNL